MLDFASNRVDPVEGAAEPFCFFHDLVDFCQDISELSVKLDERASALVAGLAGLDRRVANFARLVKQLGDFLFVTEQQLANRRAHLLMLRRIAPQDMFEEKQILFLYFFAAVEVGMGLKQRQRLAIAAIGGLKV